MSTRDLSLHRSELTDVLGIPFSDEQWEAISAPLVPGLIVAGAGSGKTTVMAARVVWLVGSGLVPAHQVLGLTFTNKAASELRERISLGLGRLDRRRSVARIAPDRGPSPADAPGEPMVSTYHSFAARLITDFGVLLGIEPDARLMSSAHQFQLAHEIVCRLSIPAGLEPTGPSDLAASVVALDGLLADSHVGTADLRAFDSSIRDRIDALPHRQRIAEQIAQAAGMRGLLADAVDEFRRRKAASDLLDFADYVRFGALLAATPRVRGVLRDAYRVVLLDEYQDTSVGQRVMLGRLFDAGHPVTAVGDPFQAIYGWRGASAHNIDRFPADFPRVSGADRSPASLHRLAVNRRSGGRILALANHVADPLSRVHDSVVALRPPPGQEDRGQVTAAFLETEVDEHRFITERLQHWHELEGSGWGDMAVLARTNDMIAGLAGALSDAAIPFHVAGKSALLRLPEVVDVVAILRVLHDPGDSAALLRWLTSPLWRIGVRDLALLSQRARDLADQARSDSGGRPAAPLTASDLAQAIGSEATTLLRPILVDALEEPGDAARHPFSPQARERFAAIAGQLALWRRGSGRSVVEIVTMIIQDCGLDAEVRLAAGPEGGSGAAALQALTVLAREFDALDGNRSLGAFLAWLSDSERLGSPPEAPPRPAGDSVTLMTVHGAKGLEFPRVVIPGLAEGVFPSAKGRGRWTTSKDSIAPVLVDDHCDPRIRDFPGEEITRSGHDRFADACREADVLEETRLAYVAVTRAKDVVLLTGHRWSPTRKSPRAPSQFLLRAREHQRDDGNTGPWAADPPADAVNPCTETHQDRPVWLVDADARREAHDQRLRRAADLVRRGGRPAPPGGLTRSQQDRLAAWDRELDRLESDLQRARAPLTVHAPRELGVAAALSLARDPEGFARSLVRPMPRPPSRAARAGTLFHEWVESELGQQELFTVGEVLGLEESADESTRLREAFLASPFGRRDPHRVEFPFQLPLAGRSVSGRIDAVYRRGQTWQVVDWKTSVAGRDDPGQLAFYRLAWARHVGVEPDMVETYFVNVRRREVQAFDDLPGEEGLVALLDGRSGPMNVPARVEPW